MIRTTLIAMFLVGTGSLALAAPPYMNFQAVLTDSAGQLVEDNVYALRFRIYDDSVGGAILWESAGFVPLQSTGGLIQHLLGATNPLPDSAFASDDLWVGITVGLDPEVIPRTRLVTVAHTFHAAYADSALKARTALHAVNADTASVALNKTEDAGELISGTLDTARFSAYEDLSSEARIGTDSSQIAVGSHTHTAISQSRAVIRYEDTAAVTQPVLPSETIVLKTIEIPPASVDGFFRVSLVANLSVNPAVWIYSLVITANGQSVGTISMANSGGGTTHQWYMETTVLRHSGSAWRAGVEHIFSTGPTVNVTGTVLSPNLDPSSGLSIEVRGSVGSTSQPVTFNIGNVIVEHDVD